jgi:hypothetical protein
VPEEKNLKHIGIGKMIIKLDSKEVGWRELDLFGSG